MKKTTIYSAIWAVFAVTTHAGDPVAQMIFRVTDDMGKVVVRAQVRASTFLRWVPGPEFGRVQLDSSEGVTDTNGQVTIRLPSKTGNVRYVVVPQSDYFDNMSKMRIGDKTYYRDMEARLLFTNHVDNKWQPWNPVVDVVIKEALAPVAMFAKRVRFEGTNRVPVEGQTVGYDLTRGDWVKPHGTGAVPDFLFTLQRQPERIVTNYWSGHSRLRRLYDVTVTIGFSNESDGMQLVHATPNQGSILRLPREAPMDGYATNLTRRVHASEETTSSQDNREDHNYLFRVRAAKDKHGAIVGALYGKISGDIHIGAEGQIRFTYYLNPTPNDRNLEFDPKKNLFIDLPSNEEVVGP